MNLTLEEIETLRWLIRYHRQKAYMEGETEKIEHLETLYDKITSLIPNKSLGEI